ncbi:MAG: hypothetical protein M3Q10_02615 [Chloroflexota bacterium]|nr:hypothetical protein [Chloroflexota bacterium]
MLRETKEVEDKRPRPKKPRPTKQVPVWTLAQLLEIGRADALADTAPPPSPEALAAAMDEWGAEEGDGDGVG